VDFIRWFDSVSDHRNWTTSDQVVRLSRYPMRAAHRVVGQRPLVCDFTDKSAPMNHRAQ